MIQYSGHKVLVTGASSGIGRNLAMKLADQDNAVVLCARDEERLRKTREEMKNSENHYIVPFDLKRFDEYQNLFEEITSDGVKLDGMVHCAGVAVPTPLRILNEKTIGDILNINYISFLCLVRMYAKKKYAQAGSIVGISAINAHYSQKFMSVYAASKAALEASVRTMALELAEKEIRINTIVPGAVNTPMAEKTSGNELESIVSKQFMGLIEPEKVSDAIIFLLSESSSYMSGRELYIDGGRLGQ